MLKVAGYVLLASLTITGAAHLAGETEPPRAPADLESMRRVIQPGMTPLQVICSIGLPVALKPDGFTYGGTGLFDESLFVAFKNGRAQGAFHYDPDLRRLDGCE